MWPDLMKKSREGGLDAIETYVFWNAHEPARRQYDCSGNLDLVRFLKAIQDEGLYAVLRIGPYVCAEWNYGYEITMVFSLFLFSCFYFSLNSNVFFIEQWLSCVVA
jgi:hypothetical protein